MEYITHSSFALILLIGSIAALIYIFFRMSKRRNEQ
ncbi:EYxxD motif small membrane protein [Bacillus smithii]